MRIWDFKPQIPKEELEMRESKRQSESISIKREIGLSTDLTLEEKGLLLYLYCKNQKEISDDTYVLKRINEDTGCRVARLELILESLQDKRYLKFK